MQRLEPGISRLKAEINELTVEFIETSEE